MRLILTECTRNLVKRQSVATISTFLRVQCADYGVDDLIGAIPDGTAISRPALLQLQSLAGGDPAEMGFATNVGVHELSPAGAYWISSSAPCSCSAQ